MAARKKKWAGRLGFAFIALVGLVAVVHAIIASGGDLLADVTVRGGTIPAIIPISVGGLIALVGVTGVFSRRD